MKLKKILTSFVFLSGFCLSSCGSVKHYSETQYMIDVDYVSDFKILQLSDIHMGFEDDLNLHFSFMDLSIKEANPNMIVVTGDLFTFANYDVAKKLFDFFDSYDIPWSVVFGNHDEQVYFSPSTMNDLLMNKAKNAKFIDYIDDDIYGNSNYCINLKQGDKTKYQLYMIDSNRYQYKDYMGYDYVRDNQIKWYENMVNYSKNENGGTVVPSLAFFHIPFEEYNIAYQKAKDGEATLVYGDNRESVSSPKFNSGLFDKMLELGSTKATFVGHDHINNSQVNYQGIDLVYGVHSTNRVYYDNDRIGALSITLHDDLTYTIDRYYHTYEELK